MPGTPPTHRVKIKPEGSDHWIDVGPLWKKTTGELTGFTDPQGAGDKIRTIVVAVDRPKPKPAAVPDLKPAA